MKWPWKKREEVEENGPLLKAEQLAELLDEGTQAVERRLAVLEVQASVVRREP